MKEAKSLYFDIVKWIIKSIFENKSSGKIGTTDLKRRKDSYLVKIKKQLREDREK